MRVLSIVHEPTSTGGGGLFEELVVARGDALERWVMPDDDRRRLDAAESYDAIMVFGGAMHPDQDAEHPWLADEAAFLRDAIDREVPLLGVCLGAQLIARAAGAQRRAGRDSRRSAGTWSNPTRPAVRTRCSASCRPVRGVPVALLQLRAARGRRAPRRERRRPPGVPPRRAHVGRAVPSRGDAAHARPLVRRGRVRAARSRPRCAGTPTSTSAPGTSAAGGSATRSSTAGVGDRLIASQPTLDRQVGARRPLVPRAHVVPRVVARGAGAAATAIAERPPEWQYAITSAPSGAPTSALIAAASAASSEELEVDVAGARQVALPRVARIPGRPGTRRPSARRARRALPRRAAARARRARRRSQRRPTTAISAAIDGRSARRASQPSTCGYGSSETPSMSRARITHGTSAMSARPNAAPVRNGRRRASRRGRRAPRRTPPRRRPAAPERVVGLGEVVVAEDRVAARRRAPRGRREGAEAPGSAPRGTR